jgi:hypothetical protein
MVLQLQFWCRSRLENLNQLMTRTPKLGRFGVILVLVMGPGLGLAKSSEPSFPSSQESFSAAESPESNDFMWEDAEIAEPSRDRSPSSAGGQNLGNQYIKESMSSYQSRSYFKAARYAFAASQQSSQIKGVSYAWITRSLLHAGMPNAASYFFIRTLQTGTRAAIQSVLTQTQDLLIAVGPDLLRKYLIHHTRYEDYDVPNRNAYLYALGKDALLSGDPSRALGYFNGIRSNSPLWPYVIQLRGTVLAILGKNEAAIRDFEECASRAGSIVGVRGGDFRQIRETEREAEDLKARCLAGVARTFYQMDRFIEADRTYDRISKKSMVWPDILFEQAWNSFARQEYNRTLGKLVSYKSPALNFVFNSEVEVLRAQSFLALCLYSDASETIDSFQSNYTSMGEEVKSFVERNSDQLPAFYEFGKNVLRAPLHSKNKVYQLANRFIRSPYFQELVSSEAQIQRERNLLKKFDASQGTSSQQLGTGFNGFLGEVLNWRLKVIRFLGGAFIKNSLLDYHSELIADYEKISFIKLEMLKRAKEKLIHHEVSAVERARGNVEPSQRNDQYRWSFNGEFWNEELGDYVFGLESECK